MSNVTDGVADQRSVFSGSNRTDLHFSTNNLLSRSGSVTFRATAGRGNQVTVLQDRPSRPSSHCNHGKKRLVYDVLNALESRVSKQRRTQDKDDNSHGVYHDSCGSQDADYVPSDEDIEDDCLSPIEEISDIDYNEDMDGEGGIMGKNDDHSGYASEDSGSDDSRPTMDTAELRLLEHRNNFYAMYEPFHNKATNTHLITVRQYSEIVKILFKPPGSMFDNRERGYRRKYQLQGNVAGRCLYLCGAVVTTYEEVFEVIQEAHVKLKHARDTRKNKKCINQDLVFNGVPEQAVACYIDTCLTVSVHFLCLSIFVTTVTTTYICFLVLFVVS
jgi:hypothetical protein